MDEYPIRLTLPAATVYVSGTVNGVAVAWTNVEGYDWQAIADRAANEKYLVELTIIDDHGQSTEASVTLYYGLLNLITDRTQADVNRVKELSAKGLAAMTAAEKAEYLSDMKGAYNASDLNRVGAAVEYIAERLHSSGYAVAVTARQNWTRADIPTQADMESYLADVEAIRSALAVKPTTPETPDDAEKLTYIEANNIEQIMLDVDALITTMTLSFVYCGMPYSGQIWEEFENAG